MKAKEEGNQLYKAKQYRDSIKRYSEAIRTLFPAAATPIAPLQLAAAAPLPRRPPLPSLLPRASLPACLTSSRLPPPGLDPDEPAFYNNRAAAHIMLLSYREALDDAKMAIARDGSNPKVEHTARAQLVLWPWSLRAAWLAPAHCRVRLFQSTTCARPRATLGWASGAMPRGPATKCWSSSPETHRRSARCDAAC